MARGQFQPFCHRGVKQGLSATHRAQQMAPARMLRAMGCHCILQARGGGPITGSNIHLWREQDHHLFGKNPILCSMFIWCQTYSSPQECISGPQRSPDISTFLIADLWCARTPALFHSNLRGSFVPGQSRTQAVWWPKLQRSSASLHWCLQKSWGDCCVAK